MNDRTKAKDLPASLTNDTKVISSMKAIQRAGLWTVIMGILIPIDLVLLVANGANSSILLLSLVSMYLIFVGVRLNKLRGGLSVVFILLINVFIVIRSISLFPSVTIVIPLVFWVISVIALFKVRSYLKWRKVNVTGSGKEHSSAFDESVVEHIIEISNSSTSYTIRTLDIPNDRSKTLIPTYHLFCFVVLYRKLIDKGVSSISASNSIAQLIDSFVVALVTPNHQKEINDRYQKAFEELAFEYKERNFPMQTKDRSKQSIYSDFIDQVIAKSHIAHPGKAQKEKIEFILDEIFADLN